MELGVGSNFTMNAINKQRFYFIIAGLICAWLLLLITPAYAKQISISGARISRHDHQTRVVIILTAITKYRVFTLQHPERIVIDIDNAKMATDLKKDLVLRNTHLKDVRYAPRHGNIRIVFDAKTKLRPNSFMLKPDQHFKARLVVDLTNLKAAIKHTPTKAHAATKSSKIKSTHEQPPLKPTGRDIIIVIDPGHGGKDPGATGPRGIHEKNVVLAISKDLQADLNRTPGIHAYLTRKSDYYISLRERLRIARKDKADLFVAIHADAYRKRDARGASVYALSERGATSEAARWLAERENYSELGGVKDFSDKSYMLRSVLLDLSQTVTITQSLRVGQLLLNKLKKMTLLHHDKVEQARFVVLKSPDIPSLLVESGFITNPYEERHLRSSKYQRQMARALAQGIISYFRGDPPHGTLFAAQRKAHIYTVHKGDTLSKIAVRYGISIAEIRNLNRLHSNIISVGQRLKVPSN